MGKSSSSPTPPDYAGLAAQQAAINKAATQDQARTDRPIQNTPWGTSTWKPVTSGAANTPGGNKSAIPPPPSRATALGANTSTQTPAASTTQIAPIPDSGAGQTTVPANTTNPSAPGYDPTGKSSQLPPASNTTASALNSGRKITLDDSGGGDAPPSGPGEPGTSDTSSPSDTSGDTSPAGDNSDGTANGDGPNTPVTGTSGGGTSGDAPASKSIEDWIAEILNQPQAPQWQQDITLNPEDQAALDRTRAMTAQQQGIAGGLLGGIKDAYGKPLDLSSLPELKNYDLSKLGQFGTLDPSKLPAQGQINLGGLGARGQLNTSGLPQLQDMDLSGMNKLDPSFGAVEGVRNAMMSRLAPARQYAREAEIQRLKSQGIPENSEAMQRALTRLDQGDTDAQQQALLAATGEYSNIFNRGLQSNAQTLQAAQLQAALRGSNRAQLFGEQNTQAQLSDAQRAAGLGEQSAAANFANANRSQLAQEQNTFANYLNSVRGQQFSEQGAQAQLAGLLRQQGLGEQSMVRQSPMDDYLRLTGGTPSTTMPQMPGFATVGAGAKPADLYGAAQDSYNAAIGSKNALNAQRGQTAGAAASLASAAMIATSTF